MRGIGQALLVVTVAGMAASGPVEAQWLILNGYATQGYGSVADAAQTGTPDDGSLDMRSAALLARLSFDSASTQLVLRAANRRTGAGSFAGAESSLDLEWAYVEGRVMALTARFGRMPVPRGLMNEVRDVGTLMPFYAAPRAFYTEVFESVDGVTLSLRRAIGAFDLEGGLFLGAVPIPAPARRAVPLEESAADTQWGRGGQFVLGLPIPGARIVGGAAQSEIVLGGEAGVAARPWGSRWVGVEYLGYRLFTRAELEWTAVPETQKARTMYVQAGVALWGSLWLNVQRETAWAWEGSAEAVPPIEGQTGDWALGLLVKITPGIVAKAEHHWYEGSDVDRPLITLGPDGHHRYFVISLAAAF